MIPYRDNVPSKSFPAICWLLLILCVIVFLKQLGLGPHASLRFLRHYALVPSQLQARPQSLFCLLSMQFLHGGWLHLIGNMWFLMLFGPSVEQRMRKISFLIFYLLCGVVAALLHFYFNKDSSVPALGASGAISGILGAYLILYPRSKLDVFFLLLIIPIHFQLPAFLYLLLWFYLQWSGAMASLSLSTGAFDVAFWAHVGGFIAGILLLPFFLKREDKRYI